MIVFYVLAWIANPSCVDVSDEYSYIKRQLHHDQQRVQEDSGYASRLMLFTCPLSAEQHSTARWPGSRCCTAQM
jgi:hypothetical protein